MTCCILHNVLRTSSPTSYTPDNFVDIIHPNREITEGEWRSEELSQFVTDLPPTSSRRPAYSAEAIRESFKNYFQTRGQVPWQFNHVYTN